MARTRLSRAFAAIATGVPALALMLASAPHAAFADDGTPPPDPGVARVSVLAGGVDVTRADSGDTVAAAVNAPLSEGDYIATDADSHAEVQFDYGTQLRVGENTQLRFTQLDAGNHQMQLAAGTVDLRVFRGLAANAEVQTPQATIKPDENGSYVVSVDADGNSQVTARAGRVDVITDTFTQSLIPGSTLSITGDSSSPQFQTVATAQYGSFDTWVASRDATFARIADHRYADAGMVGAEDLYANGTFVDNAQYGQVWVPRVRAGWAPYHDGRWVWEPYYGWTWVDNEPWGWEPFHYGNWFYAAGTGWAWYPGAAAFDNPYVYRPALVAFFSFGGNGSGFSISFGNVGWVPIAPNEPFHPWWNGYGNGYNRNTTIVNDTTIVNNYTITKVYNNSGAPGGVSGTSNGNFSNGNFGHVRYLQSGEIANAQPVRSVVPIVPTTHNLAFDNHVIATPIAPVGSFRAFHIAPQPVGPTFAEQQQNVKSVAVQAYPSHAGAIARFEPAPSNAATGLRASPRFGARAGVGAETTIRPNAGLSRPVEAAPDRSVSPTTTTPTTTIPRYARPVTQPVAPAGASTSDDAAAPTYRAPTATGGTSPERTNGDTTPWATRQRQPSTATNGSSYGSTAHAPTYRSAPGYRQPTYRNPAGYHAPATTSHPVPAHRYKAPPIPKNDAKN